MIIALTKWIDKYVGSFLVWFWSLFLKKRQRLQKVKEILIIRLWALGDSVLTLVLIRVLKRCYPSAKIYIVARRRNRVVYENNRDVEKILTLQEAFFWKGRFDLVFDTEPYLNISAMLARLKGKYAVGFDHALRAKLYDEKITFNEKQHMVQNYLDMVRILGFRYDTEKLEKIGVAPKDKEVVERFLKQKKIKRIAGITVGAAETATQQRMWPLERFAEVADYLSELGFAVFFVASQKEKDVVEKTQHLMKHKSFASYEHFTLAQSIHLISTCSVFVSNDTGPMHIAAAQGVKTIGIFSANTPVLWGPYGKGNIALYKPHRNEPCIDNTKGTIRKCDGCAEGLRKISAADVLGAIDKIVNKKK